jgi:crossover junction endodeoxyribonuclease RusA
MKIEFFVPFPPTINSYYSKTRNGIYISKKGAVFRASGIELIRAQLRDFNFLKLRLHCSVIFYAPDARKRDLDNYLKPLLDVITHSGIWLDDSLVDQLSVYRGIIVKGGSCFVRITEALPILENDNITRENMIR